MSVSCGFIISFEREGEKGFLILTIWNRGWFSNAPYFAKTNGPGSRREQIYILSGKMGSRGGESCANSKAATWEKFPQNLGLGRVKSDGAVLVPD